MVTKSQTLSPAQRTTDTDLMECLASPRSTSCLQALSVLALGAIVGCGFHFDVPTLTPTRPPQPRAPAPPPEPPPEPPTPPPAVGDVQRLTRRMFIDLLGQLPPADYMTYLVEHSEELDRVPLQLVHAGSFGRTMARWQTHLWELTSDIMPEYQRLSTLDPEGVPNASDLRQRVIAATEGLFRMLVENRQPFAALLASPAAVVYPETAALWQLPLGNEIWDGEGAHLVDLGDRPPAGLLFHPGFLAALPVDRAGEPESRAAALVELFACADFHEPLAHTLHLLPAEIMEAAAAGTPVSEVAANSNPCSGCHGQFHDIAPLTQGAGSGQTGAAFGQWTPPAPTEGHYAGHYVASAEGLARAIRSDPRVLRCQSRRWLASFLQRPVYPLADAANVVRLVEPLRGSGLVQEAMLALTSLEAYQAVPMDDTIDLAIAEVNSGLRLLKRHQWQSILRQLHPTASQVTFPSQLDPGSASLVDRDWSMPSAGYWEAVNRVVRTFVDLAIDAELATGSRPSMRRLLPLLPADAGVGATPEDITAQIEALWLRLTSRQGDTEEAAIAQLVSLWNAVQAGSSDPTIHRLAWKTTFAAILMSQEFYTY